jgi:group I intron endonuclease
MIYYIYKITNLCNGKTYIGMHRTKNLDDGYMGSGKLLKAAIKKYGKENFQKDILETFDNEEDMILKEKELVTNEFILSEDNYNIMPGGKFGSLERNNLSFTGKKHSETTIEKIRSASIGRKHSEETKKKISKNNFSKIDPEKQKEHAKKAGSYVRSEEHKRKISEAIKNKLQSGNYKPGRKKSVGGKSTGADTGL